MTSDEDDLPDLVSHSTHARSGRVHCISSSDDDEIYESIKVSSVFRPATNFQLPCSSSDASKKSGTSASNSNCTKNNANSSQNLLMNPPATSSSENEDELPDLGSRVRLKQVHCISASDDEDYEKMKVSSVLSSETASKTKDRNSRLDSQSSRTYSQRTESSSGLDTESQDYGLNINASLKRTATMSSIDSQESNASSPSKKARKRQTSEEKLLKQQMKAKQQEEKEAKKRVLEAEKQKKRLVQEARKHVKLGECLKHISASIDIGVMNHSVGANILTHLQNADIKYEVRPQPHPSIISFWREVMEVKEGHDYKVESINKEVVEDEILVYVPSEEFISLIHSYQQNKSGAGYTEVPTLYQFVQDTKQKLENRNITLIVQGVEQYFRGEKTKQQRAYRKQVVGDEGKTKKNGRHKGLPVVARLEMEEALVDLQLRTDANVKFFEKDEEVAKCVLAYTKAVAEAPFKRERNSTGFSFHISSGGSVKVDRDGFGLAKVWRQQVQQFKNVTAEVANAILEVYRSPLALYQAYEKCSSQKEAELLLQDIEVRRGVGVMATTRRVGKELSRRFYQLMTSTDGDFVIM